MEHVAQANRLATPGDMIRSLAVILIPLVVLTVLFTDVPKDRPVSEVDWRSVLAKARREAPYPVLAPTRLPAGWRATQAEWAQVGKPSQSGQLAVRNFWQLGFLNSDQVFIGLDQGDLLADDMVREQSRAGTPDGQSTVNGQVWQRLISPDQRTRSLVRREPKVTSIISGDLPYAALDAYAATLSTSD
jgi:Protein of unknown function (DUF4245)